MARFGETVGVSVGAVTPILDNTVSGEASGLVAVSLVHNSKCHPLLHPSNLQRVFNDVGDSMPVRKHDRTIAGVAGTAEGDFGIVDAKVAKIWTICVDNMPQNSLHLPILLAMFYSLDQ